MDGTATTTSPAELAYRESDGIEVTLLWHRHDDRLVVSVLDAKNREFFELEAPRDRALDVFYHPFSYAARTAPVTSLLLAA